MVFKLNARKCVVHLVYSTYLYTHVCIQPQFVIFNFDRLNTFYRRSNPVLYCGRHVYRYVRIHQRLMFYVCFLIRPFFLSLCVRVLFEIENRRWIYYIILLRDASPSLRVKNKYERQKTGRDGCSIGKKSKNIDK